MPTVKLSYARTNGQTKIRMPDDSFIRTEAARNPMYAPLLGESHEAPSFDQLKDTQQVRDFLDSEYTAGKTFTRVLQARGDDERPHEREVLFIDQNMKVCAISRWRRGEGVTFSQTN